MLKQVFDKEQMDGLNYVIKQKNDMSILNSFNNKELTETNKNFLNEAGIIDKDGNIREEQKEALAILSNPQALVKLMFTGGVNKYEHTISYDKSYDKYLSFTTAQDYYTIDTETSYTDITKIVEDFVGKSNLKSLNFNQKLSMQEALVTAAMIDMERRAILRAFVDELPPSSNSYTFNMIWRMVHSSNASIQWFVYCFSEVIGEHITLRQEQLKQILEQLVTKGLIIEKDRQYHLSEALCQLANRMIVIDNVLAIETIGSGKNAKRNSAGFTCMQAGIHDLLVIDYDGAEVVIETISSAALLENIKNFLKVETFRNEL
jgi:hypothetical protein